MLPSGTRCDDGKQCLGKPTHALSLEMLWVAASLLPGRDRRNPFEPALCKRFLIRSGILRGGAGSRKERYFDGFHLMH